MWTQWMFTAGRVRGVTLRVHFSALVGLLIACIGTYEAAGVLGYCVMIVLHELAHAAAAKKAGARVTELGFAPVAGYCRYEGNVTPLARAAIAWAGVAAQAVLFVATIVLILKFGFPKAGFIDGLAVVFGILNPLEIFVNLVPVEPLDGGRAWKIFPILRARARRLEQKARFRDEVITDDRELPDEMKQAINAMWVDAAREAKSRKQLH